MSDSAGSVNKNILVFVILIGMVTVVFLFYQPLQLLSITAPMPIPEDYVYQLNVPQEDQRVVCIVFDDGWLDQYTEALPILDKYGFKVTFGIITAFPDKMPMYMNWNQIQTLHKQGHAIASHSVDHLALATLNVTSVEYQLYQSKHDLLDHGINTPLFIYPEGSGAGDPSIETLIQQQYCIARSIIAGTLEMNQSFNPYTLPAYGIENSTTPEMFKSYVNQASGSTVVILFYHHISDSSVYTSITKDDFVAQMQYLYDNNFTIQTLNQLFTSTVSEK
jgi:hypothetical protein